MSTDYVHVLNPELLGSQGLRLNDVDYVRVVAAMGIPRLLDGPLARSDEQEVPWTLASFRREHGEIGKGDPRRVATRLIDAWTSHVRDGGIRRISLRFPRHWTQQPDPTDVLGVLSHPAVGVKAVRLDWTSPQADLRWQWPLRVAAFADDFGDLGLEHLSDEAVWPANRLAQPRVLGREWARAEALIVRADARSALARILSLAHRIRAGLVLLVTPLDVSWRSLRPHLDALMVETQAGGLAVVQWPPAESFVQAFNQWMNELSHAAPLDLAFGRAFGAGRSMLGLDPRLLQAAALPRAMQAIAGRLERMSATVDLHLPPETAERIRMSWTRSRPPRELAHELKTRAAARDISFGSESAGASAIVELETATQGAERTLATEETPRYLQGDVYRFAESETVKETRGLVLHARHALDVFIDAAAAGTLVADVPVPDRDIDWGAQESVSLQVMLAEPNQWDEPLRGTIELPRHGRSSTHRFVFTPNKAGPFHGRVTLYYRGRILQTALLETSVLASPADLPSTTGKAPGIVLRVEAALRRSFATLAERRRFDACIACNHTVTRQAALTAAGKDGAYIASTGDLKNALANISGLLTQVAQDADRYRKGLKSKANAELLGSLAVEGNALYRKIVLDYIDRSTAAKAIRDSDYLQIVTMEPDAIVPLEFIYDYALPKENAKVCPHAVEALRNGACPTTCRPMQSPAEHVCPLGFWGLRKVIERHIHVPELNKAAKVVVSEPIAGRDALSLKGRTLVGMSEQVESPSDRALVEGLKKICKTGVTTARNWTEWTAAISKDNPVMLVALPHTGGTAAGITLEIGGDTKRSNYIDGTYVHVGSTPAPLTVLLGCDTANTADTSAYLHHVEVFRQADAALVVGTVATVLGKHAADMAERLIEGLAGAIRSRPGRFGEVLLRAKRTAVADSLMIGLCLVAFGDADWKIVPDEE